MSRWVEKFKKHPLHKTVNDIVDNFEKQAKSKEKEHFSEQRRFKKFINYYSEIMEKTDPELIPLNQLDAWNNNWSADPIQHALNYANTGDVRHLRALNDSISPQLTGLANFRSVSARPVSKVSVTKLENEADAFAEHLIQYKNELDTEIKAFRAKSVQIQDSLMSLSEQIEERRKESNAQQAAFQLQFSNAQEGRNQEYADWTNEARKAAEDDIQETVKSAELTLGDINQKFKTDIESLLHDSKEKHQNILKLHGIVAQDSITGGYVDNAKREQASANFWRIVSLFFIVLAAGWLFFSYLTFGASINWEIALTFLPLTGILLFGAAYSAQQSTRHRAVAVHNQRFALEMAAIDPFIQSFSPEDQLALKKELTSRFFGDHIGEGQGTVLDEHAAKRLFEAMGDHVIKPLSDITKFWRG